MRENDCEEHFLKSLYLRGRTFLGGLKYTKETHGNCKLRVALKLD